MFSIVVVGVSVSSHSVGSIQLLCSNLTFSYCIDISRLGIIVELEEKEPSPLQNRQEGECGTVGHGGVSLSMVQMTINDLVIKNLGFRASPQSS